MTYFFIKCPELFIFHCEITEIFFNSFKFCFCKIAHCSTLHMNK